MNPIPKAGAIVVRHGTTEPEILVVYRANLNDWSFPKGHCEAGETNEVTAIRETKEETGIDVEMIETLPSFSYVDGHRENVIVEMFLATPIDPNQCERPEHEGDRVEWIPLSRAEERLTYENNKSFLRAVTPQIRDRYRSASARTT